MVEGGEGAVDPARGEDEAGVAGAADARVDEGLGGGEDFGGVSLESEAEVVQEDGTGGEDGGLGLYVSIFVDENREGESEILDSKSGAAPTHRSYDTPDSSR